jgi:hypothetical protein
MQISSLATVAALPALVLAVNPFELASNAGQSIVRGLPTKVDQILSIKKATLPEHPYAC